MFSKRSVFKNVDVINVIIVLKRDTMNPKWVNVVDILESENVQPYKYTDALIFNLNWLQKEREIKNG